MVLMFPTCRPQFWIDFNILSSQYSIMSHFRTHHKDSFNPEQLMEPQFRHLATSKIQSKFIQPQNYPGANSSSVSASKQPVTSVMILSDSLVRRRTAKRQKFRLNRASTIHFQEGINWQDQSAKTRTRKEEQGENNCLIQKYFLQFNSQGSVNPSKNFKRKYSCSTNCSGLGDANKKRSSSTHHYSIISNNSQQQFQDLNSLSLNSTIQVRKQKRIENKFASKKNEVSNVERPIRDTNLDIWYNRRLQFGSSILKFGLRSKDIIIVVFNQNGQRDLKNSVRQPQSCLGERDIQNAKDKWSQFIRNVNRTSLIVYMEINELEDNQIIQANPQTPRKKMDNTCTVNQNQERVIRVTSRKQFTRQYNLQLTIFTSNGCARTSKDLLLEVIDYFLDHVAKENRKNELGPYSYSQILKKEKPNVYPPTPLSEPSQPKSTRPKKHKTIINTQLNFQKPLPQDFKAVKDQTHLRGSSMPMRTPFKQSVSLSKRAITASTVEQEKFNSQKKSNNNTKGWFDFMKTFWLNGTSTNSQIQQPSSSKDQKLK